MGSGGKMDWFAFKCWRHIHSTIQVTVFKMPVQKIVVANGYVEAGVVAIVVVIVAIVVLACVSVMFLVEIVGIIFGIATKMTTFEFEVWTTPPRMRVNICYYLWSACWAIVRVVNANTM